MKSLFLANYALGFLNCFAMLLFLAIFIGALIWVNRKSSIDYYRYMEKLPLQGD